MEQNKNQFVDVNNMTAVEWLLSELAFINSLDDVIDGRGKS
jgi:hypothetical protein